MSALGHKRTLKRLFPMSAIPPKADIAERCRFVAKFGELSANIWEIRGVLILLDYAFILGCDGPANPTSK